MDPIQGQTREWFPVVGPSSERHSAVIRSFCLPTITGLAAALSVGLAAPAAADSTPVLIGDSISAGHAGDLFLAERPAWDRDAVKGRLVNQLPVRLDERSRTSGRRAG